MAAGCVAGHGGGGPTADVIRQTLRVVAVTDGRLVLEIEPLAACGGCAVRASCGTVLLAPEGPGNRVIVDCPAHLQFAPGDWVVVSSPVGAFLGAATLAYLLPPATMALSAGALSAAGWPDGAVLAACLVAFVLSFWPVRRAERGGQLRSALRVEGTVPDPSPRALPSLAP